LIGGKEEEDENPKQCHFMTEGKSKKRVCKAGSREERSKGSEKQKSRSGLKKKPAGLPKVLHRGLGNKEPMSTSQNQERAGKGKDPDNKCRSCGWGKTVGMAATRWNRALETGNIKLGKEGCNDLRRPIVKQE